MTRPPTAEHGDSEGMRYGQGPPPAGGWKRHMHDNPAADDITVRVTEIRQENQAGDVSYRDIEWLTTTVFTLLAELAAAREALAQARDGLRGPIADIIAIQGHLQTPYPDDPRWTPWTRFAERALARIDTVRDSLARAAVGGGGQDDA